MAFLPWETCGSPRKRERKSLHQTDCYCFNTESWPSLVFSSVTLRYAPLRSVTLRYAPLRCLNPANCIQITPAPTDAKRKVSLTAYVPSLFVSNFMSLASKVDELRHVVKYANLDLVRITESWLKSHIHDNAVA